MTNNIMARGLNGTSTAIFSNDQYSRNKLLHFSKLTSLPEGNRPPNSFLIAQVNGGMSTRNPTNVDAIANMAGGRNLEAIESGVVSTNNPILDRIISLLASSTGTLSVNAIMDAALLLQASSSGLISSDVLLGAIFSVTATSSGQSSYDVFLTALANIQAEAGGPESLSPQGLANAVWGKQLSSLNAGELQQLLESLSVKLDELHKINGLDSSNPMTVTQTSRVAGSISQEFTGDGIDTTTITRL